MSDVPPPDATVWWDEAQTTADALAILRLTATDVDAEAVRLCVADAGHRINQFLDLDAPPPGTVPETWTQELTYIVVRLYRAKDSPPSSADDFGLSPGYLPSDPMQASRAALAPYRRRVGIA